MASLNKVMLIGNLTRDAELRYIPSGSAVLDFRLAVNRKFKKQDGTEADETCFVDVCLWGKRGEAVSQYLTKGKPLFVEGRLQMDEWNDKTTGEKRSKLRVVAENIEFLGGGRSDAGGGGNFARGSDEEGGASSGPMPAPRAGFNNAGPSNAGFNNAPPPRGPSAPNGGPGFPNGGHGTPNGGHGAPGHAAPAQQQGYARPATAPGGSMASAMQVDQDDIPF